MYVFGSVDGSTDCFGLAVKVSASYQSECPKHAMWLLCWSFSMGVLFLLHVTLNPKSLVEKKINRNAPNPAQNSKVSHSGLKIQYGRLMDAEIESLFLPSCFKKFFMSFWTT